MDRLDDALEILDGAGPDYGGGLANHGPMAAEALFALGRADAVVPWTERYRRKLGDEPAPGTPVDRAAFREALGQMRRYPDCPRLPRGDEDLGAHDRAHSRRDRPGRRGPHGAAHVSGRTAARLLACAWQACAAIYAVFGMPPEAGDAGTSRASREELIGGAVKSGDEHAIKFTEACLRLDAAKPSPAYRAAASRAVELLS